MSRSSTISENASSLAGHEKRVGIPDIGGIDIDSPNQLAAISPTLHHKSNWLDDISAPSTPATFPLDRPKLNLSIGNRRDLPLSERDSIFATSYTVDDSNTLTPRSPPATQSNILQDVASSSQLSPASTSRDVDFGRGESRPASDTILKRRITSPKDTVTNSDYSSKQSQSGNPRQSRSGSNQNHTSPRILPRSQTAYQLQMLPSKWSHSGSISKDTEEATGVQNRQRQEHRIEAVLTDEPAPHGRSRKASHYLGIFKEQGNTSDIANTRGKLAEGDLSIKEESHAAAGSDEALAGSSTSLADTLAVNTEKAQAPLPPLETSSQATSPLTSLFSYSSSPTETEDEIYSNVGDGIEWRSGEASHDGIPIRLLKDNRSWRGNTKVRSTKQEISQIKNEVNSIQSPVLETSHQDLDTSSEPKAEVDEEYSDKEHIASATYYPHEAASPESHAEDDVFEDGEVRHDEDILSPLPMDTIAGHIEKLQEHVDAKLDPRLRTAIPLPEQDAARTRPPSGRSNERTRWSIVSVPSDTEYESGYDTARSEKGYESSVTDGGEMTPTPTPRKVSPILARHRKRPLKAVELKPYPHQVGGHTKVFSFSKQAICKQLNNRENVFYEVVERRHPEMLDFLPKYLGVLNVTYKKIQHGKGKNKKQKKAEVEAGADIPHVSVSHAIEKQEETPSQSQDAFDSHTRMISHSSAFDKLDDNTIPQVVYANNMHIIPDNLFKSRILAADAIRPSTSDGALETVHSEVKPDVADYLDGRKRERPSLTKSMSAWGATMVNTHFKEKVLREVFSPAHIHHRQRGRRRRSRNDFHSLRGQVENYSDFAETSDVGAFSHTEAKDDSTKANSNQNLMLPINGILESALAKVGSAPQSGEKSLSRLESGESSGTQDKPSRTRSIRRRRSGGGLRRKQHETADGKRGEFEYYEEADVDPENEQIFPMELLSQTSPAPSIATSTHSPGARTTEKSSDVSTAGSTPLPHPTNPLEAQQSPDERVEHFLLLEDLTAGMSRPCVLDLKMGTRQYGIDASRKKQQSQRQKCKSTTSQQLGVRLCGMQVWNAGTLEYSFEDKYAGRDLHAGREFQDALLRFLSDGVVKSNALRHIPSLLEKLSKLESIIVKLPGYRFYASSLLVLYDGEDHHNKGARSLSARKDPKGTPRSSIDIRLVDFANCVTGEDNLPEDCPCPPKDRDGVDKGYIRGLRSLRRYLRGIWNDLSQDDRAERGEFEKRDLGVPWKGDWEDDDDDGEVSM